MVFRRGGGGRDVKHENLVRKELMRVKFERPRIDSQRSKHQICNPVMF